MIVFPLFQLTTPLNKQHTYETENYNELWYINLYVNIGNIVPSKISIKYRFVYIHIRYVEYETSISSWHIWNDDRNKMIVLPLFQITKRLNPQNTHVNIVISSWHIGSIDLTKMRYLTLFEFDTRLLTSKQLVLFTT